MLHQTVAIKETAKQNHEAYLESVEKGPTYNLGDLTTIGRDPSNEIHIDDPFVSLQHCQIEKREQGYFVRDLHSRNGVLVNNMVVGEAQLIPGSRVRIGLKEFVFQTRKPLDDLEDTPLKSKNIRWREKLSSIKTMASTDLLVFLLGESGSGKEVMARTLHELSPRADGPFISINCSALTESLVESELFGHVRGSYTGATGDRKGAFESARGGTLFLDEIGDLPLSIQPKLLRALENNEIRPVGGDKIIQTNVRVITATHKNLEELVAAGRFRGDLYFRINIVKLTLPPLRDRIEDFEDLLYGFARQWRVGFSVEAIELLEEHSWPGNIRELKNVVSRAHALFPNTYIQPEHVPRILDQAQGRQNKEDARKKRTYGGGHKKWPALQEVERDIILARLRANHGNQRRTSVELGIPKSTLHDRIKFYEIDMNEFQFPIS